MKLKYLLIPLATVLLFSAGASFAGEKVKSSLVKGKPYFVEDTTVVLKVKRLGGDKSMKYTSQEELNTALNTYLRESLKAANMLADKPEDAQASLQVSMNFTRTFVAFTNRRMNPLVNYKIFGTKDGNDVLSYSSGKLYSPDNMYGKKSEDQELQIMAYFADTMVKKIKELEK